LIDARTRDRGPSLEAVEFVRFCYRRRRIGWPELYDEMCAVAGRGLYRGWGTDELSAEGIGFGLYQMPTLAALVSRVVAEEREHQSTIAVATVARAPGEPGNVAAHPDVPVTETPEHSFAEERRPASLRLAGAPAGA
jgi:hypothetical protein